MAIHLPFLSKVLLLSLIAFGAQSRLLTAAEAATESRDQAARSQSTDESIFLRVVRTKDKQPTSLDTSIVSFVPQNGDGIRIDLVSAVHIGDKEYYRELNKAFDDYDVVLYELVAPEGTRIPKGAPQSSHPVGMLQGGMKNMLELEHQLAEVDYMRENFVHADMSPEQFAKSMQDRGESFLSMFFKAMGQGLAQQSGNAGMSDARFLAAMLSPQRAQKLKIILADQFSDMEKTTMIFNGPEGSTIITERNKAALEVLKKQLQAGRKRIAIFYGAGHMPDMAERLQKDFDLKRSDVRWVKAWDLTD